MLNGDFLSNCKLVRHNVWTMYLLNVYISSGVKKIIVYVEWIYYLDNFANLIYWSISNLENIYYMIFVNSN